MKPDMTVLDQGGRPPPESASDADTNQSLLGDLLSIYLYFADEVVEIYASAA